MFTSCLTPSLICVSLSPPPVNGEGRHRLTLLSVTICSVTIWEGGAGITKRGRMGDGRHRGYQSEGDVLEVSIPQLVSTGRATRKHTSCPGRVTRTSTHGEMRGAHFIGFYHRLGVTWCGSQVTWQSHDPALSLKYRAFCQVWKFCDSY